jgi:23S rRNA (guanosine2251-2'-O)-methyltransferase
VKLKVAPRSMLQELCHTSEHQGYLAKMGLFPYATVDQVLEKAGGTPLFLVLDSIQDPYNFGAMLRSAGAFGVDGVFVARDRQVSMTSLVARSSAGVVNRVPLAQADDLAKLVRRLRDAGIQSIAGSERGTLPVDACELTKGTAIVIGNEGTGVGPELLAVCDRTVRIPLNETVGSLNAAAAAAVFLYEVRRQRGKAG